MPDHRTGFFLVLVSPVSRMLLLVLVGPVSRMLLLVLVGRRVATRNIADVYLHAELL